MANIFRLTLMLLVLILSLLGILVVLEIISLSVFGTYAGKSLLIAVIVCVASSLTYLLSKK